MKTFSAMSHGDLIIIRDALKGTIQNQKEVKLYTEYTNKLFHDEPLRYIDKMTTQLHDVANKFSRISELLVAIDDALHQDDSE